MIKMLRPRDGLKVPNPKTGRPLLAEGERVQLSAYWLRRLNDGDVVVVDEPKRKTKPTKDGE